jgi:chaperonin GroES
LKLKPLHDWAVLLRCEAENRTAGGLFIPDTAKEKPREGVVEAIGPGAFEEEKPGKKKDSKERRFIPSIVKPGDRVLYESWAGKEYKIGSDERVLVRERNILGLIERPVQMIPASTTITSETAVIKHPESLPAKKNDHDSLLRTLTPEKAKPAKKITKKKAIKKASAKKAAKKAAKKSPAKAAKPVKASKAKKSGKKK